MTKIQQAIIILAAFGVVSIVLSQVNTSYSNQASANTQAISPSEAPERYVDASNSEDAVITINQGDNNAYITNIYESGSGSFYLQEHEQSSETKRYLPSVLKKTEAHINVTGPIARTRLTQVFANNSDKTRSGVYVFPLPQDAAVDGLLMKIGERVIEGQIQAKATAQKMFVKAKAQGKRASLVSQLRPNMFTNHIANIPPRSEIVVTIEYQQFIVQNKHNYELRLPLSITPRYESETLNEQRVESLQTLAFNNHTNEVFAEAAMNKVAVNEQQSEVLEAETLIHVKLNTGLPISLINSEHHPIKTTNTRDTEYKIELDTQKVANKDFVLNWRMQAGYKVQASHFTYQSDQHEYGLITLMPPLAENVAAKRNIVFILDVSGSMVGDAIVQAKQALAMAISNLQENDYFNIITFSSDAAYLWPQSEMATRAFKDEALGYLYNLEANGGTEIKKALNMAFNIPNEGGVNNSANLGDHLNQILFITDGSVGNEDELMQLIYQKLGSYRLFTVGIGSAPNAFFMQEAAIAGKGTFTFIGDTANVKPKMQALLDKIKRPALRNIELNIKDAQDAFGFEIYPSILPDLYANEPLVIAYKRQVANTSNAQDFPFTISGDHLWETVNKESANRPFSSQLPAITANRKQGLHKYWAKMKIQDLNRQLNMRSRHSEGYQALKENIKQGITKVALDHHLVSQYTSLIAIDHSLVSENANSQSQRAKLAQHASARLPQTANPSTLYFIIGLTLMLFSSAIMLMKTKGVKRWVFNRRVG